MDQFLYEMLYIVDTSLGDTEVQRYHNEVRDIITQNGGKIRKEANWGTRKLAFEIKKKTEGTYFNVEFYSTPDVPKQIQQYVNTHASILRHLLLKVPKAKLAQEKLDADKEQKRLDEARKEREELHARQAAAAQAEAEAQAASTASTEPEETKTASSPQEQTASTETASQPVESTTETEKQEPAGVSAESNTSNESTESEKTE